MLWPTQKKKLSAHPPVPTSHGTTKCLESPHGNETASPKLLHMGIRRGDLLTQFSRTSSLPPRSKRHNRRSALRSLCMPVATARSQQIRIGHAAPDQSPVGAEAGTAPRNPGFDQTAELRSDLEGYTATPPACRACCPESSWKSGTGTMIHVVGTGVVVRPCDRVTASHEIMAVQ